MKFAIVTVNVSLFQELSRFFRDISADCVRFDDDLALARGLFRDDYRMVIVDTSIGADAIRALSARIACYGDRRIPLLAIGMFADRSSLEQIFEAGASDAVLVPFRRHELIARTTNALRRVHIEPQAHDGNRVRLGAYTLDPYASTVQIAGRTARVTTREFAIAWMLFSHAGNYVTRRQLAGAIWGSTEEIVGRRLEQHIYKLRRKLALNGEAGVVLRTMYAHGYRIEQANRDECLTSICEPGNTLLERDVAFDEEANAPARCPDSPVVHGRHSAAAIHAESFSAYSNVCPICTIIVTAMAHTVAPRDAERACTERWPLLVDHNGC